MNFLAHLALSVPEDEHRLGAIMGDFMAGVELATLPKDVQAGIYHHRQIDAFTDSHGEVLRLRQLFSSSRRRFAGIILDVTFDHFLVRHWDRYHSEDLREFVAACHAALGRGTAWMPPRMRWVVDHMISQQWLIGYGDLPYVGRALDGLASRLSGSHGFHGAIGEVEANYAELEKGFLMFYPQLQQAWGQSHDMTS